MRTTERRLAGTAPLIGLLVACGAGPTDGTNRAPSVTIVSPVAGTTFAGGDVIQVQASVSDPERGTLPTSTLEWWVELHHDTHTHPVLPRSPLMASPTLTIPRTGHQESDVFYRIHVRALDPLGLGDTAHVDVQPRLMTLGLVTIPAGLQVTLDHQPRATPFTIPSIVGMERVIGAVTPQSQGGFEFVFQEWQHGGGALQTVTTSDGPLTLTARFAEAGLANLPPAIAISAPLPGAIGTVGQPVNLVASAQDPDGTVARVEFFVNGSQVGEDLSAPFTASWTPVAPGTRTITARATDNHGAYTLSAAVTVTVHGAGGGDVEAPVATLVSPASGTLDLTGGILIEATATDNLGVTEVEFDVDGVWLGTAVTAPYSILLPATAAHASGVHVLRARARDAAGNWSDWSASTVTFGGSIALPTGLSRTTWVSGFNDVLTAVAVAPDGRMFVAEQTGRLRVVKNGQLLATPFVTLAVDPSGERGLLGVALHPDFGSNGQVYLYYTTTQGGVHNRISRFVANGDVALTGSEVVLVDLPPLSSVPKHNGGAMAFGGDGKLYVAVGENSDGSLAPRLDSPFGKLLRFNADGSIPLDNPFLAQTTGINRAIWARGLRNPFTFAIQPGTGRIHINDVGAESWEEVNLGRAGANYGWPATEGPTANPLYDPPILAYGHFAGSTLLTGRAVVGAAFYHPSLPLLGAHQVGSYFFADYVEGWIYRMDLANGNAVSAFAHTGGSPTGLVVGADGALYVLLGTRIDRIAP